MTEPRGGGGYKCEICGAMFEYVEQLMTHLNEHTTGIGSSVSDQESSFRSKTSGLGLLDDEYRTVRVAQHTARYAPQQELREPAAPSCSHDDEVDLLFFGEFDYLLHR